MYGASDKRALLEPRLMWATPGQRGFPPRNGVNTPVPGLPAPRPPPHVTPLRPPASQSYPLASKGYPSSQGSAYPSSSQRATGMTAAQQEAARKQQEAARKQQEALAKAAELRQVLNSLEKVDDEGRRSSLLDTLCVVEDVLGLPLHPSPPGIANGDLKVDLLKHQVGWDFMVHDNRSIMVYRVKRCSGVYNMNTLRFQRKRKTNRFSSGS